MLLILLIHTLAAKMSMFPLYTYYNIKMRIENNTCKPIIKPRSQFPRLNHQRFRYIYCSPSRISVRTCNTIPSFTK